MCWITSLQGESPCFSDALQIGVSCSAIEAGGPNLDNYFHNLSVEVINDDVIRLSGFVIIQSDGGIDRVSTFMEFCTPDISPADCPDVQRSSQGFSSTNISLLSFS